LLAHREGGSWKEQAKSEPAPPTSTTYKVALPTDSRSGWTSAINEHARRSALTRLARARVSAASAQEWRKYTRNSERETSWHTASASAPASDAAPRSASASARTSRLRKLSTTSGGDICCADSCIESSVRKAAGGSLAALIDASRIAQGYGHRRQRQRTAKRRSARVRHACRA